MRSRSSWTESNRRSDSQEALRRCALRPVLFAEIAKEFDGGVPSEDNLRIYLQKRGFITSAASAAASAYRETMELVTSEGGEDDAQHEEQTRADIGSGQISEDKDTYSVYRAMLQARAQQH